MESGNKDELIQEARIKAGLLRPVIAGHSVSFDVLFDITINSTNYQRQIMVEEYRKKYSKNLIDEMYKALSGDLKEIVPLMYYNPYELDARLLHKALHDKRDEKAIIEIIVSRPHWFLQIVEKEYKRVFKITLKEDIEKDKKKEFRTFILCILTNERPTVSTIKTKEQADAIAKNLSTNLKKYGSDVNLFKSIFVSKSREDLIQICRAFKTIDKKNKNLYDMVDSHVDKSTREIIKALIYAVVLPSHYFAHLLKKSIVGAGTDNVTLNRVLVTRCEVDMDFIRNYYKIETNRDLLDDIAGDTSGQYKIFTMMLANV